MGDPEAGATGDISTGQEGERTTIPCTVPDDPCGAPHPDRPTNETNSATATAAFLIPAFYARRHQRSALERRSVPELNPKAATSWSLPWGKSPAKYGKGSQCTAPHSPPSRRHAGKTRLKIGEGQ